MRNTRIELSNELIMVTFDIRSGELLEFRDKRTGENFIKNSLFNEPQPFILFTKDGKKLYPAKTHQILSGAIPQCEIVKGENSLEFIYTHLTDGDKIYPASVSYKVKIKETKLVWNISVNDLKDFSTCRFPCINGIYLGESWQDDTLYYPYRVGGKFVNPIETFATPKRYTEWRWQEYRYIYTLEGQCGEKNQDGKYGLSEVYPGDLSMSYMVYSGEKTGLYFGLHQKSPSVISLGAVTPGPLNPAMCFYAQMEINEKGTNEWQSSDFVVAVIGGDWREGADIYREYKEPLLDQEVSQPSWLENGVGMITHYDFKYQNGEIVHTYSDIPKLKEQAREFGLNHIMLSGWHKDGFDNGFPMYYPDEDLGTEEELFNGCKTGEDVHVSCYINSRIANVKYKDISDRVVIEKDGSPFLEHYGNANITFACMCPNSKGWQQELLETVCRVKNSYGLQGVYLDQLSCTAKLCYSKEHGHDRDAWSNGYKKILSSFSPHKMAIMGEMLCDEYGPYAYQFIQTFLYLNMNAFPEMYRYTFPKHNLIEVLCPSKNLLMRPVFIEQKSDTFMQNAFVFGMYFWIYDLENDNTFTLDIEQLEKLKKVIKLREFWIEKFGKGIFKDTLNLSQIPSDCLAKYYQLESGSLIAVVNKGGKDRELSLTFKPKKATLYTFTNLSGKELEIKETKNGYTLSTGQEEYAIIKID